jgi:hypothetical protein
MAQLKHQWQSEDRPKYQIHISDIGEETVTITHVVHTINMGNAEDPDLIVAQLIYEWQQTEAGKWIMENSNPTPSWHCQVDNTTYGQLYLIKAYLTHKQLTFWKLKYE